MCVNFFFFFFQAEDGIRDHCVTGVQTCALPICNVVFATLIGGSGSLYGPVIGSFVFIWLSESVSAMWARWPLLLGVAFVIVVLFFRGGVVEAWGRFWAWRAARRPATVPADAPR